MHIPGIIQRFKRAYLFIYNLSLVLENGIWLFCMMITCIPYYTIHQNQCVQCIFNANKGYVNCHFLNTGTNSQATSCSNWSQECKSSREIFNEAMESLSSGQYKPMKTQPSQPLAELSSSTRKYYIRQATSALKFICESIAPGQELTGRGNFEYPIPRTWKTSQTKDGCINRDCHRGLYKGRWFQHKNSNTLPNSQQIHKVRTVIT